jgi:hypothetical protein
MSEWWTYTLSDFLLFSPRTYYRLLQRHNEAVWPGQIVTLGLGLALLALIRRSAPRHGPLVSAIVAALWAWVAWGFLWERYATINWAATYFAWMFAVEVLLLGWLGVVRRGLSYDVGRGAACVLGIALLVLSLAVYPALAPLLGRPWRQAEVFGVAPDPTVIATLGVLAAASPRAPRYLLVIPAAWCVVSGATVWAMGQPDALVVAVAGLTGVSLALTRRAAA